MSSAPSDIATLLKYLQERDEQRRQEERRIDEQRRQEERRIEEQRRQDEQRMRQEEAARRQQEFTALIAALSQQPGATPASDTNTDPGTVTSSQQQTLPPRSAHTQVKAVISPPPPLQSDASYQMFRDWR